jgi:hypothetical protein
VDEYEAHRCEHEIDMTETATSNRSKEIDPVPLALGDPEPNGQSRNRIAEMPQGPRAPRECIRQGPARGFPAKASSSVAVRLSAYSRSFAMLSGLLAVH